MNRSLAVLVLVAACKREEPPSRTAFYANTFPRQPTPTEPPEPGRLVFHDRSLSASGNLACATCHDPTHAYAPANDLAVQMGGPDGSRAGSRATPSLRYLQRVPRFTEHFHDPE